MANEPEEPKQFHDVAHPGKTAADASSRPVIISNRPMLKDPMLSGADAPEPEAVPTPPETPEPQAEHTHEPVEPSEAMVKEQQQATSEPAAPVHTDQTYPNPVGSEASQNVEHIHNLVEDKTYFVHIGTPSRRRAFMLLLVPALLVAAAVAGYYAYSLFVK